MTLSRFLRDYLYIPLGGNRKGPVRRYANLMITMLLGGLWHGAGITFVLWGLLHGLYLCINNGWIAFRKKLGWKPMPKFLAITITFVAVVFAWVPFRSGNFELASHGNAKLAWEATAGFYKSMIIPQVAPFWTENSEDSIMKFKRAARPIAYALIIAFFLPNTQQFLGRFSAHFKETSNPDPIRKRWWNWKPVPLAAAFVVLLFVIVTLEMDKGGEFIYFQF
jgi:D-alanyl-lipoteichoic acid acyltransferase DltB (MBOAT superfamily)